MLERYAWLSRLNAALSAPLTAWGERLNISMLTDLLLGLLGATATRAASPGRSSWSRVCTTRSPTGPARPAGADEAMRRRGSPADRHL